MNEYVKKGLILSSILLVGVAVGRYSLPAKVVEKEKIVYQDKIVEKKVEVKDIKKKDHKIYIRIEHVEKDGSKTIETKIMDDLSSETSDTKTDNKTEDKSSTTEKSTETTYSQQNLMFSLLVGTSFNGGLTSPNLGLSAQKRFIGPLYLGAFGFADRSFGLSLGLGF